MVSPDNSFLGQVRFVIVMMLQMSCLVQTDHVLLHLHLPHVDQILGQSHGLRVPRDGNGPVQVGGGVAVLAVGDPDHGPGELSAMIGLQ